MGGGVKKHATFKDEHWYILDVDAYESSESDTVIIKVPLNLMLSIPSFSGNPWNLNCFKTFPHTKKAERSSIRENISYYFLLPLHVIQNFLISHCDFKIL